MPKTLYGWYSRHIERLFVLRNALYSIPDVINIERLQDANLCPLHNIILDIGGDNGMIEEHIEWHKSYADWSSMIKTGLGMNKLWIEMEKSKQKLKDIIEKKTKL